MILFRLLPHLIQLVARGVDVFDESPPAMHTAKSCICSCRMPFSFIKSRPWFCPSVVALACPSISSPVLPKLAFFFPRSPLLITQDLISTVLRLFVSSGPHPARRGRGRWRRRRRRRRPGVRGRPVRLPLAQPASVGRRRAALERRAVRRRAARLRRHAPRVLPLRRARTRLRRTALRRLRLESESGDGGDGDGGSAGSTAGAELVRTPTRTVVVTTDLPCSTRRRLTYLTAGRRVVLCDSRRPRWRSHHRQQRTICRFYVSCQSVSRILLKCNNIIISCRDVFHYISSGKIFMSFAKFYACNQANQENMKYCQLNNFVRCDNYYLISVFDSVNQFVNTAQNKWSQITMLWINIQHANNVSI